MKRAAMLAVAVLLLWAAGCVERKLVINSEPPGAPVWVDEVYVGVTPLEHPFVHYGPRRIRVGPMRDENDKVAYQEQEGVWDVDPPYYQVFPIDFIFEVIYPETLVDEHKVPPFRLRPPEPGAGALTDDAIEELMQQAEAFRRRALTSIPEVSAEEALPEAIPIEEEGAQGKGEPTAEETVPAEDGPE